MIELKYLIGPGATLSAVSIAIFVFSLPRALSIYNEKMAALHEVDVPDLIKKQKLFNFFVYQDSILLFAISFVSLVIGFLFVTFLYMSLMF